MTEQASAKEVNEFHQKDDLDSSHRAHHHTLGFGPNQASPGSHNHDGTTSPEIYLGVGTVSSADGSVIVTSTPDPLTGTTDVDLRVLYELREQTAAFTNADAANLPPLAIRRNPTTGRVYLVRNT